MSANTVSDYQKNIKKLINGFSAEQNIRFAWLCGIRALPFLCVDKGFNYWGEDKYKNLHSVFHALDYSVFVSHNIKTALSGRAPVYIAENCSYAARSADAYAAASTALSAARAAKTADAARFDSPAIIAFLSADASEAAANTFDAFDIFGISIREIIDTDIDAISKGDFTSVYNDTTVYGSIWSEFLDALREEGCGYWADLYENLFKNHFEMDKEELERRMNVPEEISKHGAANVGYYLEMLNRKGTKRLNEARIVIIGEQSAGKTSLARKLNDIDAELPTVDDSTDGVDVSPWILPDDGRADGVNVHIWDFAGHVITHAAHRFFLSERCVYIIVYDGRTDKTISMKYWLDHVKNYGGDSPIYILLNKKDEHLPSIEENTLRGKYPNIKEVQCFSLKDDYKALGAFRDKLAVYIKQNPAWNQEIPTQWYEMKEKLHNVFMQRKDYITVDDYNQIAKDLGIDENDTQNMRQPLHDLGICLSYSGIKELSTFVINPNWISYGVYKIINWLRNANKHELWMNDLPQIFIKPEDTKRYPEKQYGFLFEIMQAYELAYPIRQCESEGLVVPHLMPRDQPEEDMQRDFPVADSLMMRYKMETALPPDTITRFIVRHHNDIMQNNTGKPLVWRFGVKLRDKNGTQALVIEDDRYINLHVKGHKAKDYLSLLRASLNEIFETYKSADPTLEYKITETREQEPIFADDKTIIGYNIGGKRYYEHNTKREVDVNKIITIYNIGNGNIINIDSSVTIPNTVDAVLFSQVLDTLKAFLKSEQADAMSVGEARSLQAEISEAETAGHKSGWKRFREVLSNAANVVKDGTTIVTPIVAFLAANPNIPKTILSWFGQGG